MTSLIEYMLLLLCANYKQHTLPNFNCTLKTAKQVNQDVLRGKTLKILTFDDMPLSAMDKDGRGMGIAMELLKTLQEKYGFKYELAKVPPIEGDDKTGALSKLANKEADMIAAFLPVIPGSHDYITWGVDLWQANYYVLLKRPGDANSGSGLLAPFDKAVWILILLSLCAVGPIMYGIMWLRMKLCQHQNNQIYPLPSCVWFVYGALLKQGSTINPAADSARMVFATWWIFILILTAFYTANLTAFLTLSLPTLPIKAIEDVAKGSNRWFAVQGGAVEHAIKDQADGDLKKLRSSVGTSKSYFIESRNQGAILQRLLDGWLYLDDALFLTRFMYNDYKQKTTNGEEESKRCTFVLSDKGFLVRPLSFAYQKDSILPSLFNSVVQRFLESGILHHLMIEELPDAVVCPLNLGNKERRLRNLDLFTTYAVVMSGFLCAFAVFCGEILWRCYVGSSHSHIQNNQKLAFKSKNDLDKLAAFKKQVHTKINGREYFTVTMKGGDKRLIPMRTPSALLFQYG